MSRKEELKEKIKEFPVTSGVYLMKSKEQKIIYVGKAKVLKNRVRSYFSEGQDVTPKTRFLMTAVWDIEYLITKTELEALLLEAQLIKKHKPKYNIRLKDDKSYPYIRFSLADEYPRLYVARKVKNDGSWYFGPYPKGQIVYETIRFINETFKIRDCADSVLVSRKRPCLSYQINKCSGPCVSLISKQDYLKDIEAAKKFLLGNGKSVVKLLELKMWEAAEEERFEQAGRYRDSIEALKSAFKKQKVIKEAEEIDIDVLAFVGAPEGVMFETFHVRKGVELGSRSFFFSIYDHHDDPKDLIVTFLGQYYEENFIPDLLYLSIDIGHDLTHLLSDLLKERGKKEVTVKFAGDVLGSGLLEKANQLAEVHFKKAIEKGKEREDGLLEIQKKLGLAKRPDRIECFDISTFQGQETVASQVVFENGSPAKEHYRRYKIKTVEGINDFASMYEVLSRRFKHAEMDKPDLLVVDGGKGQLAMAVAVLNDLGIYDIPVVGLAKSRVKSDFQSHQLEVTEERFYLPQRQNPVIFRPASLAFQILVGARDEAHRFAITYHRKLRESSGLESVLDDISGLGEKRKKTLLTKYKDIQAISKASVDELAKLSGFNRVLAERVLLQLEEIMTPEK